MVCPTCSTTFCRCQNKECPTCARAKVNEQVLVEYTGDQPRYSVLGYNFRQAAKRAYVQKYDVERLTVDPHLVVVAGAPA
jgi:hypothetical protein